MKDKCEICGVIDVLTAHHLIPKVKHNKQLKKKYDIDKTINICSLCHTTIHALFTENELRDYYNTIDLLKENEKFLKYYNWRIKHLDYKSLSTKMSKNKKF